MLIVDPPEQVDFTHNKQLLNRYRFVEYEMLRILAAWLPATAAVWSSSWRLAGCCGKKRSTFSTSTGGCARCKLRPSVILPTRCSDDC